jgi:hypothetical protein
LDCARSGQTDSLRDIFNVTEDVLIHGTPEEQKLMLVGFLEQLKNISSAQDFDYAVFEQWLGPESYVAWRWLEKRWQGKHSLEGALRKGSL